MKVILILVFGEGMHHRVLEWTRNLATGLEMGLVNQQRWFRRGDHCLRIGNPADLDYTVYHHPSPIDDSGLVANQNAVSHVLDFL